MTFSHLRLTSGLFCAALLLTACPTVKLEAPDKPITINLNVNISQEVRVKVDKDVDEALSSKGLF